MEKIALLFPFAFIGFWVLTSYYTSKTSWKDLVNAYPVHDQFVWKKIGVVSALINDVTYEKSMVMKHNDAGIYLRPIWIFRLFHEPILIPWNQIKEVRSRKILFSSSKELVIEHPFLTVISLRDSSFKKIAHQLSNVPVS